MDCIFHSAHVGDPVKDTRRLSFIPDPTSSYPDDELRVEMINLAGPAGCEKLFELNGRYSFDIRPREQVGD